MKIKQHGFNSSAICRCDTGNRIPTFPGKVVSSIFNIEKLISDSLTLERADKTLSRTARPQRPIQDERYLSYMAEKISLFTHTHTQKKNFSIKSR